MSIIKSVSVGQGDMYYIKHGSDNFTTIDCMLPSDPGRQREIVDELIRESRDKTISRFISTHPDSDHVSGIEYLDSRMPIYNFYCVRNQTTKDNPTSDFDHYCSLRDGSRAFYVYRNCSRRWMNREGEGRGQAGIDILWPDTSNEYYKDALAIAEQGGSPNNTSLIMQYRLTDGVSALWMGDMETDFMENIESDISLPEVDILFAPHHGRTSGRVPTPWLNDLNPRVIVLGEAPAEHLHYYPGWNTIAQNSAGDIAFDCGTGRVDVFVGSTSYSVDFLDDLGFFNTLGNYLGSFTTKSR